MWQCQVCGYIHDGVDTPDLCPKCETPKQNFHKLAEKEITHITRSRYTNDLHQMLFASLDDVIGIAEEGIEDNLDPGCLKLFECAKKQAGILQQMIKAELATHVGAQKWG